MFNRTTLSDIDDDFLDEMRKIVPALFAPKNIIVKRFGGQDLSAKCLNFCFNVSETMLGIFTILYCIISIFFNFRSSLEP